MRYYFITLPLLLTLISCNPFAPGLDESSGELSLFDQKNLDGVFQIFQYAYNIRRDTMTYGQLIDGNFTFLYPDYDRGGAEISWGRDEEMRTEDGLFRSVQGLNLIWNNIIDQSFNSDSTSVSISRGFSLTVTFRADDIVRVDGYASFQLVRQGAGYPWMIVRWHDDSNH
jgi:hypothetical protein